MQTVLLRDAGEPGLLPEGKACCDHGLRLASPSLLVDIGKIPDLRRISVDTDGFISDRWSGGRISSEVPISRAHNPLLSEAVGHIAHYQVRNRGTVGGSMLC